MSSYPNAYCVKCGTHTETQQKHTVVLQNNARALRGVCPTCESDVFKIMPKKAQVEAPKYPDAFCVKCQKHTPTNAAKTVILENASRALTGTCSCCGSDVYRLMPSKEDPEQPAPAKHPTMMMPAAPLAPVAVEAEAAPSPQPAAAPAKRAPGKALEGALVGQASKLQLKVSKEPARPMQPQRPKTAFRPGAVGNRRAAPMRRAEPRQPAASSYLAAFAVVLGTVAALFMYLRG